MRPPGQWGSEVVQAAGRLLQGASTTSRLAALRTERYLRHADLPATAAPALAQAIRFSEPQARAAGARSMPAHVRQALEPYYPAEILDEVRWTLAGRRLSLGSVLIQWYLHEGAVTLDTMVVFSDQALADNVWLWAHELTHVEQYRRYGVEGFAERYVRDWRGLEARADARAYAVTARLRAARKLGARQAEADAATGLGSGRRSGPS